MVLALSIASVTYGALLGAYVLAGLGGWLQGRDGWHRAGGTVNPHANPKQRGTYCHPYQVVLAPT